MKDLKYVVLAHQSQYELSVLKKRVSTFRKRLMDLCDSLEENLPKYTGWFVFLKRVEKPSALESEWECVGFYNPNVSEEDEEPVWDLCIPIPEPESIEEFEGW